LTTLFSSVARSRSSGGRYNEPIYSFLDSSARPSVASIREFWESWFAQYPDDKKAALAARFQSYDNHPHLSAFLELFTFAVLKHAGYDLEVEPSAGTRALEFFASMATGDLKYYVECTTTGQRASDASADSREDDVNEAINNVPTGRYMLGVSYPQRGAGAPPLKRIQREVGEWLLSLAEGPPTESEWTWEDSGWSIRCWAAPYETDGADDSADNEGGLGFIGPKVFDVVEHLRLRNAIDRKASKYGSLDKPLLVVINSTEHQSERDLMKALLGDTLWQINMTTRQVTEVRKPNGVFFDANGPRNLTLSTVLHGYFGASSFAGADRSFTLVHHPFAAHPLPYGLFTFCEERYFDPATGDLVTVPARSSVTEFFALPSGWPFFESDPHHF
jgi:hypothetical protein